MRNTNPLDLWARLVILLLLMCPLAFLFLMPGHPILFGAAWLWCLLLISIVIGWLILGITPPHPGPMPRQIAATPPPQPVEAVAAPPLGYFSPQPRPLRVDEVPEAVKQVMEIHVAVESGGVRVFQGPLRVPTEEAYERIKRGIEPNVTPTLEEDHRFNYTLVLVPRPAGARTIARPSRPWINWLLFIATLLTTTWAGAAYVRVDLLKHPEQFAKGLPYALGLMGILGIHELGHFFTARHHKMNVTPPYFIPIPFALGTFGAFIQMRSQPENRKSLFDVAVAGPLAGLAIAIPALLIGLHLSHVAPYNAALGHEWGQNTPASSSILFAALSKLVLPEALRDGYVVQFHPLAFAGWLGLIVTALNLLPIGQLDGGHMARAMFGGHVGRIISTVAMWSLFLLALFVWPGLMMWAIIVFFIAGRGTPPLNDATPISTQRKMLGYLAFLILILIITPLPHVLLGPGGLQSPYL